MSELKNLWEYMFCVQMKREGSGCNPQIQAAEFHQKGVVFLIFFVYLTWHFPAHFSHFLNTTVYKRHTLELCTGNTYQP
jgi:hypothetical protein